MSFSSSPRVWPEIYPQAGMFIMLVFWLLAGLAFAGWVPLNPRWMSVPAFFATAFWCAAIAVIPPPGITSRLHPAGMAVVMLIMTGGAWWYAVHPPH
jgi:hypothetical protein